MGQLAPFHIHQVEFVIQSVDALERTSASLWGTIPEWVQSGATILALIFAAVAAVAARRTYQIESERDKTNSATRQEQYSYIRRSQASLVSAWWGRSEETRHWGAYIRNASGAPIFQVSCTTLRLDDAIEVAKGFHSVVPPSLVAQFDPLNLNTERDDSHLNTVLYRVKISFTDAAGVRWERNEYGRLSELRPLLRMKSDAGRASALTLFAENFQSAYGVKVSFQVDPDGYPQDKFMTDVSDSEIADAFICPHDWIGALIESDTIEPLVISPIHRAAFANWTLESFSYDGSLYGIPTATDTVSLIRNTDLIPEAPTTFEELIEIGQSLCDDGITSMVLTTGIGMEGDPFQTWPVFTSAGGWLFGYDPESGWDLNEVGLASSTSIRAFERFRELGEQGLGILQRSIGHQDSVAAFAGRRSALLISTSDGLARARTAGIPVSATAVPPFDGGAPAQSLSLVHGTVVAKNGPNKSTARDLFSDYLSHEYVASRLSEEVGCPPALASHSVVDPNILTLEKLCLQGQPMPSAPSMNQVWRILGRAQAAAVAGESPDAVARRAAADVIAAVKSGGHTPVSDRK